MKKRALHVFQFMLALAAVASGLTLPGAARADEFSGPEAVTPGDTFTFDIAGYNYAGTTGYLLTPDETTTFGTTQTYTAAGYGGQNISVTSSETINGLTTTDTVTVTTPTNFLSGTKVSGTTIAQLQLDIGDANAGSNTIDYSLPVTGNTNTGYTIYGTTTFALGPVTTLTNGAMSLAAVEGVNAGGSALYSFAFNTFSYSVTYNTIPTLVPEPSALALGALGLVGLIGFAVRRRALAS